MKELKVQTLFFPLWEETMRGSITPHEFKHTYCTPPCEAQVINTECEQHKESHYCRSLKCLWEYTFLCVCKKVGWLMLVSSDQWPGTSVRSPGAWLQPVSPQSAVARFVSICRSSVVPLYFLEPLQGDYKPAIVFKITFDWRQTAFADWTVDLHHWMSEGGTCGRAHTASTGRGNLQHTNIPRDFGGNWPAKRRWAKLHDQFVNAYSCAPTFLHPCPYLRPHSEEEIANGD